MTACVFLFFFGNNLLNNMSSDMIVYESPRVVTKYQDILDRVAEGEEMKVVIHPATQEGSKFRDALPGTVENKLWQLRQEELGLRADTMLMKLIGPMVEQKAVGILREEIIKAGAAYALLAFSDNEELDDMNAFFAFDPDAKKFTNVVAFRKGLDTLYKRTIVTM